MKIDRLRDFFFQSISFNLKVVGIILTAIAKRKFKLGKTDYKYGDEISNWHFIRKNVKRSLINAGYVELMEKGKIEYVANQKLKLNGREYKTGDIIKEFSKIKPTNQVSLLNTGRVKRVVVSVEEEGD